MIKPCLLAAGQHRQHLRLIFLSNPICGFVKVNDNTGGGKITTQTEVPYPVVRRKWISNINREIDSHPCFPEARSSFINPAEGMLNSTDKRAPFMLFKTPLR